MKRMISVLITIILLAGIISVSSTTYFATAIDTSTLVTFGSYPQSRVTDSSLIATLNSQSLSWIYYDYYVDGAKEEFMEYADIIYSGSRYRAVRFSHYRSNYTNQNANGYEPDVVYWFKYEPLIWRVLDDVAGLLITENLIDCQPFHNLKFDIYGDSEKNHYVSNWKYSSLRTWINDDFYNTAFSTEKNYIKDTSLTTPCYDHSEYDADPTTDKIFLLSSVDTANESFGFSFKSEKDYKTRVAYGSDYAKCQGLSVDDSGAADWWTRSPGLHNYVYSVRWDGAPHAYSKPPANTLYGFGIRPVLTVDLQSAISKSVIKRIDSETPTGSIRSTNNIASSQTVTLYMSDDVGVAGYYWGTSSKYTDNTYTATNAVSATKTISVPGTYYLNVKDTSENVSANYSIVFYKTTLNANGGSVSPSTILTQDGNSIDFPDPTRNGYEFDGWYTAASGGTKVISSSKIPANTSVYAHWTKSQKNTYTVRYDTNGGTGTPSAQEKTKGVSLTLSSVVPTKSFMIYYNANGGSVSPASKSVSCVFKEWNTTKTGGGKNYAPGSSYSADADVTLYAQWTNPSAGSLATPKRSGYTFDGWYNDASGGKKVTASSGISENTTFYAHWSSKDIYNIGEETYSFSNYGDADSPGGHCFGMSMTSSGYYLKYLDFSRIGGDTNSKLYSFSATSIVKAPICFYQNIQGSYSMRATVAGGNYYLTGKSDIKADWREVVDYVKNHEYDDKGTLQIGFRKNGEGGHAINFLRYEKVEGQDRIYAYDNNFPTQETYFYQNSGQVYQAPVAAFNGAIDCIALRDVAKYFSIAGTYDASRFIYCAKDDVYVRGINAYSMEGKIDGKEYVMYEIPEDQQRVILIPLANNADFIYMDTEYSFGVINDETYGAFDLAEMNEGSVSTEPSFKIYNAPTKDDGSYTSGDVDGNGDVLANDARLALRYSAKLEKLAEIQIKAADVDGSGDVLANDARQILRYSAKLQHEFVKKS